MGSISVRALKEMLSVSLNESLLPLGFSGNKTMNDFKLTDKLKNKITISIDTYKFSERLEFRLLIFINIKAVDSLLSALYSYCGLTFDKRWPTIIFSEGDFHPKVKHLEHKFRNAAIHIVTDSESLHEGIEDCNRNLMNEIIPKLNQFIDLNQFQKFIITNYEQVVHLKLIIPALVVLKLCDEIELNRFVDFLWDRLELQKESENNIFKKLILNIGTFNANDL
jgi:hypothetical protein